ncbi:MAG: hypothetical protein J6A21_03900 [Lentisphaeria bacterium]|nr:hypothetical protein [Lentisphaeria bacterium]
MKITKLFVAAAITAFAVTAFAAEKVLDINGAFKGAPIPTGWAQNKPNSWDAEGKFEIKQIPDIEKTFVSFESASKKMHLYTRTGIKVSKGDVITVKFMARGKGNGVVGMYNYPMGTLTPKGFKVSEDWTEITEKFVIPSDRIKEVRLVIGLQSGGKVEIMDLSAKQTTAEKK